ncbi:hypothetical protein [Pseudohoeflea suaedae]|uniref:hypothetical protein n=1 Tax=Pseudohoeflea suaedae TaxID=877384 RepID=UPI001304DDB9|nr:hypothetical protein [Pseudohoeflea suaedae]
MILITAFLTRTCRAVLSAGLAGVPGMYRHGQRVLAGDGKMADMQVELQEKPATT